MIFPILISEVACDRRLSPGRLVRPPYSLETLIGAGPFLTRAIENVLDRWRQWSG
jgi:hypothetical protein